MSTNYSSSLVPNCIQHSSPTHPNNDTQRNTNRTPTNVSPKSNQQLKSPIAKRPPNAKVTLQGWLHKQGSDGLQLWRKRWFVLSELCLYYYKSTEEDKLLGSVLLPSYCVSECRPEDKVGRKFAFKLEHANMRTYLLAAESHKSMLQWICALNLACMLQVPISYPTIKSLNETSQKTQHYNNATATTPNSAPQQTNAFQPLYENAPPKPRRVSESVRYMDHPQSYTEYNQTPQKYSHIIYANQHDQCMTHHMPSALSQSMHTHHVMERRTPDTYGRSNYDPSMRAKINVADYEDVYNVKSDLYEPPRSPLAYNHVKNNCPNPRQFSQQCNYRPLNIEPTSYRQVPHYVEHRKHPIREVISRPHSVDFLEHNSNDYQCRQPERPKSSLDINQRTDYELEKDFYSEQDYANKMRQSAMYLHYRSMNPKEYRNPSHPPIEATNPRYNSRYVGPVEYYGRQPTVHHIYATNAPPIHREHHLSVGENLHRDNTEQIYNVSHRQMGSHPVRSRSKSPQVRGRHYQNIGTETIAPPSIETEKKREESMKRLIEWKQRMLQSPLNHKQISRRKYDQQMMSRTSPSSSEHRTTPNMIGSSNSRYHRVPQQPPNTSYSSDDEDTERSGSVQVIQAGRTKQVSCIKDDLSLATTVSVSATDKDSETELNTSTITSSSTIVNNESSAIQKEQQLETKTEISESDTSKSELIDTDTKAIFSEIQKDNVATAEEHYMIMVPKKSILAPSRSAALFESLSCESEESSYVEMMQGLSSSTLLGNDSQINPDLNLDMQTYETVCFREDKSEPVYMELGGEKHETPNYHTLPDILISSEKQKSSKSDSSDADDEASKDFNSLDAPTQPRFSLSDTFRPASYYLGVNRVLAEFQDSSDSELVSPPPIPDASALLDDLDTCIQGSGDDSNGDSKKKPTEFVTLRKSFDSVNTNKFNSHVRSYSAIESYNRSLSEFENKNKTLNKRRPVSSDFCSKLNSLDQNVNQLLKNMESTSRESIYTPMMSYDEPLEHEYENICVVKKKVDEIRDNLHSSSNTLTSSASESTFVAKELLNDTHISLPESPCSSNFINMSQHSFDTSSNISMQFGPQETDSKSGRQSCDSITNTNKSNLNVSCTKDFDMQSSETIMSQLSRDYYLLELLRSSGNSDSSTSTKNLSLNNETSDSKLDKQMQKADMFQIALTAKTDSTDIMKFGKINNKNIYHEENKMNVDPCSTPGHHTARDEKNWNKKETNLQNDGHSPEIVRRSHSLEGLLQNVLKETNIQKHVKNINELNQNEIIDNNLNDEGDHLWEEDGVWQENLRRASHRHARSLDDLQIVTNVTKASKVAAAQLNRAQQRAKKITRGVTYVNDCISLANKKEMTVKLDDKDDEYVHLSMNKTRYSTNTDKSFIIDREKLRQWDLMSSAPVLTSSRSQTQVTNPNSYHHHVVEDKVADIENDEKPNSDKNSASGSVSIVSGHDGQSLDHSQWSLPDPCSGTTHSPIIRPIPSTNTYQGSTSQYYDEPERYHYRAGSLPRTSHSIVQTPKRRQVSTLQPKISPEPLRTSTNSKGLKLSAGELLGRTHEELVLLLIQLRRQSISTYQAIEACHNEIDLLKSQMIQADDNQKLENLQKLEQLNHQLLDLGKRYEKNKPLVNLVDNMVKLGSLYQKNGNRADKFNVSRNRERLQFNQQVQERRLLAEERKDWEKLNLNHAQLQSKIQQLYDLDNALRHESGTLAGLRKEKEYLEGALQSLQNRLSDPEHPTTPPAELERVRRHQQLLERELSRVHALLAYNSKKLEETVAGNARIEQELLVLRQKLQMTQRHRNQPYFSNTVPKERKSLAESVPEMEGELKRVQWLMGDLQKQRQELSNQVRHLTDKSQSLAQQMQYPGSTIHGTGSTPNNLDTVSRATSYSPSSLKRSQSSWFETDLDICAGIQDKSPVMNTTISHHSDDSSSTIGLFSTDTSDTQQSNSLHEKQEIKTVRIVKRESERRHRDRERTGISNTLTLATPPSRLSMSTSASFGSLKQDLDIDLSQAAYKEKDSLLEPSSNISSHVFSKSTDSLATYKSPNMLQVVSPERRTIPKEKRRHHTAPDNNHISRELSLLSSNSQGDSNSWMKSERSLDDLDMERALRPRINTPDVVRSTLGHKEIKYNERTIDSILGTPSKIIIPERYMPQDLPELSAEEERQRMRKVESIKKMLSDSTALPTTVDTSRSPGNEGKSFTMSEEKRQRQHLLQLNQILAKQVIEMSKIVAEKALNALPQMPQVSVDEDELSPITPLPLYQQRENYFS